MSPDRVSIYRLWCPYLGEGPGNAREIMAWHPVDAAREAHEKLEGATRKEYSQLLWRVLQAGDGSESDAVSVVSSGFSERTYEAENLGKKR